MGRLEKAVVIRQLLHLLAGGIDKVLTSITEVDAPQTSHAVENLLPFGIPDVYAIGIRYDPDLLIAEFLMISEWMQVVAMVPVLPVACPVLPRIF